MHHNSLPDPPNPNPLPNACTPGVGKPRILLIEDSPDILEILSLLLADYEVEVFTAKNAQEAWQTAQQVLPHLILSDIGLPGISGYDLVSQIRAWPELSQVPAIALTGYNRPEDIERALAVGFNDHLLKPIDPAQLLAKLNKFLGALKPKS